MRIGIITFHRALNYGAVLQAYALVDFLNSYGYEAEILDYRNKAIELIYQSSKINLAELQQFSDYSMKSKIKRAIEVRYLSKLRKHFEHILDNKKSYEVSKFNWEETIKQYDFVITGSDQVFNKVLTDGDMKYYLQNVPDEKRISFAASAGAFEIANDTNCIEELKRFKLLSLREKECSLSVEKLTDRSCYCHMDPVFLLSKEQWRHVQKKPEITRKYVLIFSMNKVPELVKKATEYASEKGVEIVFLSPALRRTFNQNIKQVWFASPEEFLGWISEAEYIFTDSFHGCAFSILYEKDFFVEVDRKLGSSNRITNILRYFHCEENAISDQIGKIKRDNIDEQLNKNLNNVVAYFNLLKEEY